MRFLQTSELTKITGGIVGDCTGNTKDSGGFQPRQVGESMEDYLRRLEAYNRLNGLI